jgi:hypothetical protein
MEGSLTRYVPGLFTKKLDEVLEDVRHARSGSACDFDVTTERRPGVRLVETRLGPQPVVFSLWTEPRDIAEICGDGAYPSTEGLLAIDREQVVEAGAQGAVLDLAGLVRSESVPGLYYTLFDRLDDHHLRVAVARLLGPGSGLEQAERAS